MSSRRELVSTSIVPRIKAVLTAAEQTAAIVAEEAETEAGRRTAEILAAAEVDANRIRHEAARRVEDYLAATRRRIDAFATARIERIAELTEDVLEAAGSIQERLEQATHVQQQVHAMIEALGNVAQAVAAEVAQPSPALPQPPSGPVRPGSFAQSNGHAIAGAGHDDGGPHRLEGAKGEEVDDAGAVDRVAETVDGAGAVDRVAETDRAAEADSAA
ncbi:MAG TPA: hypothetical protein VID29_09490 [Solirubrobacteraceae bacterium]